MKEFLLENWRVILEIILVLTSAVLFLLRKKSINLTDSVKTMLVSFLLEAINKVESVKEDLSSSQKLELALTIVESYCFKVLGMKENDFLLYRSWIIDQIEEILSTPQKKGVL